MKVVFKKEESWKVSFRKEDPFRPAFSERIVSHEIPSNYGLITWDGTKITVS